MDDIVEIFRQLGDAMGVVWALFQDESGELTVLAMVLLSAMSWATAARCVMATLPAREAKLSNVVAIGSGISLVFGLVGVYFLIQIVSVAFG